MERIDTPLELWKETSAALWNVNRDYVFNLTEKIESAFSTGIFYYYLFNAFKMKIDFVHPNVENMLGIAPGEFTPEKNEDVLHPKDLGKTLKKEELAKQFLFKEISADKIPNYKVVYLNRVKNKTGEYITILHQAITLAVTEDFEIAYTLYIHTDLSHLSVPVHHNVSFIGLNGCPSYYNINPEKPDFIGEDLSELFSERELEIIKRLAEGMDSGDIAAKLNLSSETVRTHRKNILFKTSCRNTTELVARCVRENLI